MAIGPERLQELALELARLTGPNQPDTKPRAPRKPRKQSKALPAPTFVPSERIVDTRDPAANKGRHFGIEFTSTEKDAVWRAIARASGCPQDQVVITLLRKAMLEFGRKYGIPHCYTYVDDGIVYLCKEFDIDVNQFPHNTPKLPIDDFVLYARRRLPGFSLAKNDMQWTVQHKLFWDLFTDWRASRCKGGCDSYHSDCRDRYQDPDFWEIAKLIQARDAKRSLQRGPQLVCSDGVRVQA